MHKPKSVLEYVTHKIIWDSETQTDQLLRALISDVKLDY